MNGNQIIVIENDQQLQEAERKLAFFREREKRMDFTSTAEWYSEVFYHDDLAVAVLRYKRQQEAVHASN